MRLDGQPPHGALVTAIGANPICVAVRSTGERVTVSKGEQQAVQAGDEVQLVCEETVQSIQQRQGVDPTAVWSD
eukprot:6210277-Prymnesium_polylepis.1